MHGQFYLHRDLKPENSAVGLEDEPNPYRAVSLNSRAYLLGTCFRITNNRKNFLLINNGIFVQIWEWLKSM